MKLIRDWLLQLVVASYSHSNQVVTCSSQVLDWFILPGNNIINFIELLLHTLRGFTF